MKQETFTRPPDGDHARGWWLIPFCFVLVAGALISTLIRLWIRMRVTRNLGWDDFMISIAMVTTIMGSGFVTAGVIDGLGRHAYFLTPTQLKGFEALGWTDFVQIFITCMLIKVSICLFLLRIVNTRTVTRAMYALIAAMVLFSTICVFLLLGICRPLGAWWSVKVQGTCLSKHQFMNIIIAHGVLSVISDLICASLPAFFLRNLQINKKTKIGLSVLMGLGVITAICCAIRTGLSGALLAKDASWELVANVGWRIPEVNIGIMCANAPILRPLYLFFTGKLSTRKSGSTGFSKQPVWPSNSRREALPDSSPSSKWHQNLSDAGDASVSMEMGLPTHKSDDGSEGPLK